MNLNLNNANRKILSALKSCHSDLESLKCIDDIESHHKDTIEELNDSIESIINEFEWVTESVCDFMLELRDRKTEGEAVIDEFIKVLCLENKDQQ